MIYDAWGGMVVRAGTSAIALKWVGEHGFYFDTEVASFSVRNRTYSPVAARWIGADRVLSFALWQSYWYVNNSPIGYIDANGLAAVRAQFIASQESNEPSGLVINIDSLEALKCGGYIGQLVVRPDLVLYKSSHVLLVAYECINVARTICKPGPLVGIQFGPCCSTTWIFLTCCFYESRGSFTVDELKDLPKLFQDTWKTGGGDSCSRKGIDFESATFRTFEDPGGKRGKGIITGGNGWHLPNEPVPCLKPFVAAGVPFSTSQWRMDAPEYWGTAVEEGAAAALTAYTCCSNNDSLAWSLTVMWTSSGDHKAVGSIGGAGPPPGPAG